MTPRFLHALDFTLSWETVFEPGFEGNYDHVWIEHDPDDPGGDTKFGIDQRDHPEIDVDDLTLARAQQIYWEGEWGPTHAEDLASGWGEAVFDTAVNIGVGRALAMLQTVLASVGLYHGVIDSRVGPLTLAAVEQASADDLTRFLDARHSYYVQLVHARPVMAKYLQGWTNRVNALQQYSLALFGWHLSRMTEG